MDEVLIHDSPVDQAYIDGRVALLIDTDVDDDGLPDAWEQQIFSDAFLANWWEDFDGDELHNLAEFEKDYPGDFEQLLSSEVFEDLLQLGLVVL